MTLNEIELSCSRMKPKNTSGYFRQRRRILLKEFTARGGQLKIERDHQYEELVVYLFLNTHCLSCESVLIENIDFDELNYNLCKTLTTILATMDGMKEK